MIEYNDNTVWTEAGHRFKLLKNVPIRYLINVANNYPKGEKKDALLGYIKTRADRPPELPVITPCFKCRFISKESAQKAINRISQTVNDGRRPVRCYQCNICSFWHLTSKGWTHA
jgi:hypothetical protein